MRRKAWWIITNDVSSWKMWTVRISLEKLHLYGWKFHWLAFVLDFWKATYQPRPERLHFILGRRLIVSICFNLVQPSYKVHIGWFHDGYSCFDFASEVKDGEESEGKVVGNKGSRIPATLKEDLPSAELKEEESANCLASKERELTKHITIQLIAAYHAAYGWRLEAYGSVLRSKPCALNPL